MRGTKRYPNVLTHQSLTPCTEKCNVSLLFTFEPSMGCRSKRHQRLSVRALSTRDLPEVRASRGVQNASLTRVICVRRDSGIPPLHGSHETSVGGLNMDPLQSSPVVVTRVIGGLRVFHPFEHYHCKIARIRQACHTGLPDTSLLPLALAAVLPR